MVYSAMMIWNLLVFFLYGWDKLCAKQHWRRIPESVLLSVAFLAGSFGAMFGMIVWNHKTSKPKFRFMVPLFLLLHLMILRLVAGSF